MMTRQVRQELFSEFFFCRICKDIAIYHRYIDSRPERPFIQISFPPTPSWLLFHSFPPV